MGRGIGELITCPELVQQKTLRVALSTSGRTTKRFDINLGPREVIMLKAIKVTVQSVSASNVGSVSSSIGISHMDLPEAEGATAEPLATRMLRDDLVFCDMNRAALLSAVGYEPNTKTNVFYFTPCRCLVRAPTLDVQAEVVTSGWSEIYLVTLYYTKIGVISSVLTQLLKVYNDVKKIYRQL